MARKNLTERVDALEAALEERDTMIEALEMRLSEMESAVGGFRQFLETVEPLIGPGTVIGEYLEMLMAHPDSVKEIADEALNAVLETVIAAVEQNINAVAEGHGINPKPPPSLYAEYIKGLNRLDAKRKKKNG